MQQDTQCDEPEDTPVRRSAVPGPLMLALDGEILYVDEAGLELLGAGQGAELGGHRLAEYLPSEWQEALDREAERIRAGGGAGRLEHDFKPERGVWRVVESVSIAVEREGHRMVQTIWRDITEAKKVAERHRMVAQVLSEAWWCVELGQPVDTALDPAEQAGRVLKEGYLAEYNAALARLLGLEDAGDLAGRKINDLFPDLTPQHLKAFIEADYRLRARALSAERDGRQRTFLVHASGIVERDCLIRIWGACLEQTEENGADRHTVALLEAQQEHIGRELHDNVGQLLTAVRMMSGNLAAGYFEETDEGYALARKVAAFAEEASQNLRTLYHGLLPPSVHGEGLPAALLRLAQKVDELPGIACHFVHDRQADVAGREEKLQLYRIAQEAVNNALKHAQAANIWIVLDHTGERLRVAVRDDGMGFDAEENATKSFGLSSMHYRARSVDAELVIEARPGEGTAVTCLL